MEQKKLDKKFILSIVILFFIFLTMINQCSINKQIKKINQQQIEIKTDISKQTEIYTTVLEQQFINNLIYSQAVESQKLTTTDLQTKLLNLNKKIESVKKNQQNAR